MNSRVDFSLPEKLAFTLAEVFSSHFAGRRKTAFTLAEVLITLGIIGIVAATTMPALIENHRRHVIESRLKQFYSMINQAVKMSVIDNGDVENWDILPLDDQDADIEWINKYLSKYLTILKIDKCSSGTKGGYHSGCIFFNNGSGVAIHPHVWFFYPDAKKIGKSGMVCGKDFFAFFLWPSNSSVESIIQELANINSDSGLSVPRDYGCNPANPHHCSGWFCTRIIERHGWKFPKDYPYKF